MVCMKTKFFAVRMPFSGHPLNIKQKCVPSNIFKIIEAEQTVFILFSVLPGVCWQSIWYLRMASPSNPHLPIYILPRILSLKKPPFWNFTLMKIGDVEHSTSYIASRFLKYFFCLWKQKSSTFKNDHFD